MRIQNPQVEKRSPLREHRGLRASFSPSGYVPSSQTLVISQRLTPWKAHGNLAVEGSKRIFFYDLSREPLQYLIGSHFTFHL